MFCYYKNMNSTFILCDQKEELCREWSTYFSNYRNVRIKRGSVFRVKCQALVSPANSYGAMRGGLDYYINIFFDKNTSAICQELGLDLQTVLNDKERAASIRSQLDWTIERKVQEKLRKETSGYLPVGEALLVETGNKNMPYLIIAPTMDTPRRITGTDNAYLAMKAIIKIAEKKRLSTVVVPGLGTGMGGLSAAECARQMGRAFTEAYGNILKW